MRHVIVLALALAFTASSLQAAPEEEVRATFDRFVAAQNAHDLKGVGEILVDSPNFLWITKGTAVWGRADALDRFGTLYRGTWNLAPEGGALRIVMQRPDVAQIFVPIVFTIGPSGQPAQQTTFLMNQVMVKTAEGWRISSILPIPVPPPAK